MSRARVLAAINSWPPQPFEYGAADCCQFVAHVARELHGVDYGKPFNYTADTVDALLEQFGGLEPMLCELLGPPVTPAELELGDPVLVAIADVKLLGVWLSDQIAVIDRHGLRSIRPQLATRGWNVCPS